MTFQAEPTTKRYVPGGVPGVDATLKLMRAEVLKGREDPLVRQFTAHLVAQLRPQKDYIGQVRIIFEYVRDNIAYIKDIRDVETIHSANFVLRHKYGDCDDKTILFCAMCESVGFPTKLAALGRIPGQCEHVIGEVKLGQHWIPADTTVDQPLGWYPPDVMCRRTLRI